MKKRRFTEPQIIKILCEQDQGIESFMTNYNNRRHQGVERIAPNEKYKNAA